MQTAEGENYVLAQQTARHLIKCTRTLASGGSLHPQDPANYLAPYVQSPRTDRKCQVSSRKDWRDTQVQIDAYRHRAANGVMTVAAAMQKELSNGLTPEQLALECTTGKFFEIILHLIDTNPLFVLSQFK